MENKIKIIKDKLCLKVEPEIIKKRINELKVGIIIDSGQNLFLNLDEIGEKIIDEIYNDLRNLKIKLSKKYDIHNEFYLDKIQMSFVVFVII